LRRVLICSILFTVSYNIAFEFIG